MSGMSTFGGETLAVTDVPTERERAERFVARMARDEQDRLMLLDALFADGVVRAPRGMKGKPAPRTEGLKPCGTEAAYQRHKARGEQACDACRAAASAVRSESAKRTRAAQRAERKAV